MAVLTEVMRGYYSKMCCAEKKWKNTSFRFICYFGEGCQQVQQSSAVPVPNLAIHSEGTWGSGETPPCSQKFETR
jgi:hypothetical protein